MTRSKKETAKLVYDSLNVKHRVGLGLAVQAGDVMGIHLSPSQFNENLANIMFDQPEAYLKLDDGLWNTLNSNGVTKAELEAHGFLNSVGALLLQPLVAATEISRDSILNHEVLKPNEATEMLRLMESSGSPMLVDAARRVRQGQRDGLTLDLFNGQMLDSDMSVEKDYSTDDRNKHYEVEGAFFGRCAYFGIHDGKGRTSDAASAKKKLETLGVYDSEEDTLDVGEIARQAAKFESQRIAI